jgi:YVTN family beta-propeller protein
MDMSEDDSRLLVANSGANTLSVVDTGTLSVVDTITVPSTPLYVGCGKGNWAYFTPVVDASQALYVVDSASHQATEVATFSSYADVRLAVSADRNTLLVSYQSGPTATPDSSGKAPAARSLRAVMRISGTTRTLSGRATFTG